MKSLRLRLLAGLLGPLTAVGLVVGFAAYAFDRHEVGEALDGQLRQLALNVGDSVSPAVMHKGEEGAYDPEDEFVITIWDNSGAPHSSEPTYRMAQPAQAGYSNFQTSGTEWRAYTRLDPDRTVQVAQRMVLRDEFAAAAAFRAVLPIVVLIPLSWLLVGWMVGRILRPLQVMTSELRRWGESGADKLSLNGLPEEVLPLALTTNHLVKRIQSQLEFRERFISDAAHELRTPLTALRLQAANVRKSASSPEQAALVDEMADGVRRMSEMVSKLLQLARADSSAPPRAPAAVDLSDALAASIQEIVPVAAAKDIDLGVTAATRQRVVADPTELRTLITNLVENAVRYTPRGGVVDLSVARTATEVLLEVRDTGPGIPDHLLDQVFARFVRVHGSGVDGSGLGLPIVKAIADRCGARVSLVNRRDRSGLVACVAFTAVGPDMA